MIVLINIVLFHKPQTSGAKKKKKKKDKKQEEDAE